MSHDYDHMIENNVIRRTPSVEMLLDLLRELGINYDPYATSYSDDDCKSSDKIDPVTIASCADTAAMLASAKQLGMPADLCANLSALVHGFGNIFRVPIAAMNLGGAKTKDVFAAQVLTLTEKNHSGFSILRECRTHKVVFCPIFLVSKGNGVARFIFDGRRLNEEAITPPPVALPNMQDFLKRLGSYENAQFSFVLFDYRHWFHQLALPNDIADKLGIQ